MSTLADRACNSTFLTNRQPDQAYTQAKPLVHSGASVSSNYQEEDCEAFTQTFRDQSPEMIEAMLATLSCVVMARRPLMMKELRAAIWLWTHRVEVRHLRQPSLLPSSSTILKRCAPFFKRTSKDEVKLSSPEMVQELKKTALRQTVFDHSVLAGICLECISCGDTRGFDLSTLSASIGAETIDSHSGRPSKREVRRAAMMEYADAHWAHHLRIAEADHAWLRQKFDRRVEVIASRYDNDPNKDCDENNMIKHQRSNQLNPSQTRDNQKQRIQCGLQLCRKHKLEVLGNMYEAMNQGWPNQRSVIIQQSRCCTGSYYNTASLSPEPQMQASGKTY